VISEHGTARVAKVAFVIAQSSERRVTIVHKANVIRQGDGLWREICLAVAKAYPTVAVDEGLVDSVAYHLVRTPNKYSLLLCPNLYGDILSDLVSGLADGLGMAPSLSLGKASAIAEPVHGSAPDIAGQGIANPIAAILSGAMLCRYYWQQPEAAESIEQAVAAVLGQGLRTPDIASPGDQSVGTEVVTQAVLKALRTK
jgi:homoisocitrate dehydrogenase